MLLPLGLIKYINDPITKETIKSHTAQYNKTLAKLFEHVASRTKISKDLLNKKKKTEWFINGDEQLQLGVVDTMVTDFSELI